MKPINQEMNETAVYGDFFSFLERNKDRLFRFWVYKRMFTPLEQEMMYTDQDVYEDYHAHTGIISLPVFSPLTCLHRLVQMLPEAKPSL